MKAEREGPVPVGNVRRLCLVGKYETLAVSLRVLCAFETR